jgi:NADH-quinone oxidoreductase subunit K
MLFTNLLESSLRLKTFFFILLSLFLFYLFNFLLGGVFYDYTYFVLTSPTPIVTPTQIVEMEDVNSTVFSTITSPNTPYIFYYLSSTKILVYSLYLRNLLSFYMLSLLLLLGLISVILLTLRGDSSLVYNFFQLKTWNFSKLVYSKISKYRFFGNNKLNIEKVTQSSNFQNFWLIPNFFLFSELSSDYFYTNKSFFLPEYVFVVHLTPLFTTFFCIFLLSIYLIVNSKKNFIKLLLGFELFFLLPIMNFAIFSIFISNIEGQVFIFYLLGILAIETALGVTIFFSIKNNFFLN